MGREAHDTTKYEPTETDDVDLGYQGSGWYSNTEIPSQEKRPGFFSSFGWLKEMLTCGITLVLIVLIILLLWWIDGKPFSKWPFSFPSLTASATFLTTLCTGFMMHHVSSCISQLKWLFFKAQSRKIIHLQTFDEASRGLWGSLKLLSKPHEISGNVAIIGAFITVLAPLSATFVQQMIEIQPRNITTPGGNASFGFAHEYNRRMIPAAIVTGAPPDLQFQAAVIKGIYDINTSPIFSCEGSCTWNETKVSLGFGATCKNVTMATLKTRKCSSDPTNGANSCNMTTPGKIALSSFQVRTESATSIYINVTSQRVTDWKDDDTLLRLPEIAKIAVYRATPEGQFFNATNINITECSLGISAYQYAGANSNGSSFSFGKVRRIELGNKYWTANISGINEKSVYKFNDGNLPLLQVAKFDLMALASFLTSSPIVSYWIDGAVNVNPGISLALAGDVDLQDRFDKMATSMTDYLRLGPNKQLAQGQKVETIPYVSINWMWGIPPAAVELVAILFTITTIIWNGTRREVPLWKASTLAMLSCQYDEKSELIRSKVKNLETLEKTAEKNVGHL